MKRSVMLVGLVVWCGCPSAPSAPSAPPSLEPAAAWAKVQPASGLATLEVPARALAGPEASTSVTPPLRATVVRVRAQTGDTVDAGAPLVDVVMPELLEAAGRFEGARVRLQAWTERQAQLRALRADGLARSLDVSEASARVAEAKADQQAARAVLLSAGLRDVDAAPLLGGNGWVALRAPFSGVVVALNASVGEHKEPAGGPVAQVAREAPVRVEARFPRRPPDGHYAFVFVGGECPLELVARAPMADPRDGSVLVWFAPSGLVRAGTMGRVVLREAAKGDDVGDALFRLPAQAIRRVDGSAHVQTRSGKVDVEVVHCEAVDCVVRGALKSSDEVQRR
jgi:membrane fusion protein, heavy metal efflux system